MFTCSTVDKGRLLVVITLRTSCCIQLLLVIKTDSVSSVIMNGKEMLNWSAVRIFWWARSTGSYLVSTGSYLVSTNIIVSFHNWQLLSWQTIQLVSCCCQYPLFETQTPFSLTSWKEASSLLFLSSSLKQLPLVVQICNTLLA